MSELKFQHMGFGAGLTVLFDHNPDIMPSLIEDVTEQELNEKRTKVTNSKFFRVSTPAGNEFVIYIKYTEKLIQNKNMVSGFMWEFSLSNIEKDKIETQYKKASTLLILLVCINNEKNIKLKSQVALLTWEDYCQIRYRSNIQIGMWKNHQKEVSRPKTYCLRRGKGQKREYYYEIKRNLIELPLDKLQTYDNENGLEEDKQELVMKDEEPNIISFAVDDGEDILEEISGQSSDYLCVKDNVEWCGKCRCVTNKSEYIYQSMNGMGIQTNKSIAAHRCPECGQIYISMSAYENEIKDGTNRRSSVTVKRIKTLVDKVYWSNNNGCQWCDQPLAITSCRLKIYKDLTKNNQIDKKVDTELFYCKECGKYYVNMALYRQLQKIYKANTIRIIDEKSAKRNTCP